MNHNTGGWQAWQKTLNRLVLWVQACHYRSVACVPWWWWGLCLLPSLVYGGVVRLRAWLYAHGWYRTHRVPCTIVSVGNLTTGGTGKTPIVKALLKAWVQEGKRVVVLSRGYGAVRPQAYAQATHPDYGDEAYELQQACPQATVIVGRNRVANAQRAYHEYQPDIIILDDGFQYLPLHRDINFCLVDALQGVGNGQLLPLGPLREPFSALQRATQVFLTKCPHAPDSPEAQVLLCDWRQRLQPYLQPAVLATLALSGATLEAPRPYLASTIEASPTPTAWLAVTAIAQPQNFFQALPTPPLATEVLPDHAPITPQHLHHWLAERHRLQQQHPSVRVGIAITEKDAAKLTPYQHTEALHEALSHLWVFPLQVTLPTTFLN